MNKKLLQYLAFFGVLFALFYGGMVYFTDFEKVKLPVINTVQPFSFTRHDGNTGCTGRHQEQGLCCGIFFHDMQWDLPQDE